MLPSSFEDDQHSSKMEHKLGHLPLVRHHYFHDYDQLLDYLIDWQEVVAEVIVWLIII